MNDIPHNRRRAVTDVKNSLRAVYVTGPQVRDTSACRSQTGASRTRVAVCPHHRRRHHHRLTVKSCGSSGRWEEMQLPTNWNPAKMVPLHATRPSGRTTAPETRNQLRS